MNTYVKILIVATLLMLLATSCSPSEQADTIKLEVTAAGTVIWNGKLLKDTADLDHHFEVIVKLNPQPQIHLVPNRQAKYDDVAKVLAEAQRIGVTSFGFVGTEEYGNEPQNDKHQ